MNQIIANMISNERCFYLGRIEAPGNFFIPFLLDIKKLYSDPYKLRVLGEEMGKLITQLHPDKVAGIETASIPLAATISLTTNIPMVYIRKQQKSYGTRGFIEGKYKKGEKFVLVDDVIGPGFATKKIYDNSLQEEVIVTDVVTIAHDPIQKPWADEKGIRFHQLILIEDLWNHLRSKKVLSASLHEKLIDWRQRVINNPWEAADWATYLKLIEQDLPTQNYPFRKPRV